MTQIKVWPHMTLIALAVALLAGVGVALWMKNEPTVSAENLPNAGRIQRVDGEVAFSDAIYAEESAQANQNAQWVAATANQPFSVGDRIYTRDGGRTSLAFNGRNFAILQPNTALDVVTLGDGRTQLALREGSAFFDVGALGSNELFEVGTPYGAVDLVQPGLYNVGFDNDGNVLVSVLSGLAQVAGLGGGGQISKGEMLTLLGTTAAEVVLSRLDGRDAGYLVDDYYRYQYPNVYDGRYVTYDAYLNDPYYFDPYRRNTSYQHVSYMIPGINDLDYYGDWQSIDNYGYVWRPRVDSGWAPYQSGHWTTDYPYGATWVSSEPWGYAPYHYGRWVNSGNQWYWIPERVNTTPVYSPALVAFLPFGDSNQIGWVPLGPGDPYAYRYYDMNWQPHYLDRVNVMPAQLVNLGIPGAVTVVPVDAFGRRIEPGMIRHVDRQVLASVRPTLEPLLNTPLRNAVVNSAWGRGKIDIPPGIAKKLDDRRIFFGDTPVGPPFKKNLTRAMRVERVPDNVKNEKFKVREDRRGDVVKQNQGQLKREEQRVERSTRQEVHRVEQQQRQQQKVQRKAEQQPQGVKVGNPARPQPQPQVHRGQGHQPKADAPKGQGAQKNTGQPAGKGKGKKP